MTDPLDELDARSDVWEHLVDATNKTVETDEIDPWCSGPDWVLPVHQGFETGSSPLWIESGDAGWALLASYPGPPDPVNPASDARPDALISGLEPMWGFACPVIGPDPAAVGRTLCERLGATPEWDQIILPGFGEDGTLARTVGRELLGLGRVGLAHGIVRQLAYLDEGFDAWWQRRPAKLRRNLRNARRRAEEAGLQIIEPDLDETLFDRILAIEHRSWKGQEESGITSPEMSEFYRAMLKRLAAAGRLRAFIATFDPSDPSADVGFIVGGIRGNRYRGLQLSFTENAASLSVSHLLQLHQIESLDQRVQIYDLGMDMDYKQRWADEADATLVLVIDRGLGR